MNPRYEIRIRLASGYTFTTYIRAKTPGEAANDAILALSLRDRHRACATVLGAVDSRGNLVIRD